VHCVSTHILATISAKCELTLPAKQISLWPNEAFRPRFPPFCIGAGLSRPPVPQETFPEQSRLRPRECRFRHEQEWNRATICVDFLTGFAGQACGSNWNQGLQIYKGEFP
jgi:hypothetical protein